MFPFIVFGNSTELFPPSPFELACCEDWLLETVRNYIKGIHLHMNRRWRASIRFLIIEIAVMLDRLYTIRTVSSSSLKNALSHGKRWHTRQPITSFLITLMRYKGEPKKEELWCLELIFGDCFGTMFTYQSIKTQFRLNEAQKKQ